MDVKDLLSWSGWLDLMAFSSTSKDINIMYDYIRQRGVGAQILNLDELRTWNRHPITWANLQAQFLLLLTVNSLTLFYLLLDIRLGACIWRVPWGSPFASSKESFVWAVLLRNLDWANSKKSYSWIEHFLPFLLACESSWMPLKLCNALYAMFFLDKSPVHGSYKHLTLLLLNSWTGFASLLG